MPHDPEKYLSDIADSCRFLNNFTASRSLDDYIADRGFRSAVERELQIIGEAMMMLEKLAPHLSEKISESKRIIRFRHVLVHGYSTLNHDLVWGIIKERLPVLLTEAETLLNGLK